MNAEHFANCIDQLWSEVLKNVNDALVLMDNPSAECLHWHGGLQRLLDNGAYNVENLSPFVKADSRVKKVVFVLMKPLTGDTWKTLTMVIRANNFKNCFIVSSLPPKCHSEIADAQYPIFMTLEKQICNWMENKNASATLLHVPLSVCHVSQNIFLMPSFAEQFSVFQSSLTDMNVKRTEDISIKSVSQDMHTSVKHFAYSLNSFLDTLQIKGDFFSLGYLSHMVASELEALVQQQKKFHSSKASVVIVDRLLDLAGPLSQTYETMFDKILHALSRIPGHTFDVCVPMHDIASCKNDSVFGRPLLAPGCIAHKGSYLETSALNAILFKKPREALIEVNRLIMECATKEDIKINNARLTPSVLKQRVLSLKQKLESKTGESFQEKLEAFERLSGCLQQTMAVVHAMEHSASTSADNLSAIEKALLEYLVISPEEVLNNIMQMISEKDEMNYKMEDILIFLAFFYLLSGASEIANENAMQGTLMEEFFKAENMNELSSLFVDGDHEEDEFVFVVHTLFDVLKRLGSLRKRMKRYSTLFKSSNPAFPAAYNPLLKQLLEDIFNANLADIPDIQFHSASLKDYIKTGFSLFMNVGKPQPRDNPLVFVILLGGATPSEMKLFQEFAAQKTGAQVILGCTGVITPKDVLKDLGSLVKELMNEDYSENDFS